MGLFYAVLLQATTATKNHQADYLPATYCQYVANFKLCKLHLYFPGGGWGWVGIIKLKANLSSTVTD